MVEELVNMRGYNAYNYMVDSPEGKMFVTITENELERPIAIFIHIGKTGSGLNAWADSLASIITKSLASSSLVSVANSLIGTTTSKTVRRPGGVVISSGPSAVAYALLSYAAQKKRELRQKLGFLDEDDEDDKYHWLDDRGAFPR